MSDNSEFFKKVGTDKSDILSSNKASDYLEKYRDIPWVKSKVSKQETKELPDGRLFIKNENGFYFIFEDGKGVTKLV